MSQGLALPESDLDLCISGIDCDNEKRVEKEYLNLISKLLELEISP
jgi:DNA polymerase sigma